MQEPEGRGWIERHAFQVVLVGALAAAITKSVIAWSTFGTDDVRYWIEFADGVRRFGPIDIYGHSFESLYNHPPLTGWMLVWINQMTSLGLPFVFLIRLPAVLADVGTALTLFAFMRRFELNSRTAIASALLVCWSPLSLIVSGFHGNTDPLFVMLALLSSFLLICRRNHLLAGVMLGMAISVKLVPVVLIPVLAFVLLHRGRDCLFRFLFGGSLIFSVLWLPVLLQRGEEFARDVLGYTGIGFSQWGISAVVPLLGAPDWTYAAAVHPASYLAVGIASLVPVWVAHRWPDKLLTSLALPFVLLMVLSPAFGMQYLVWPLAAAYLISPRLATVYNGLVSVFALVVYSGWNSAPPWAWDEARSTPLSPVEVLLGLAAWCALVAVAVEGLAGPPRWPFLGAGERRLRPPAIRLPT